MKNTLSKCRCRLIQSGKFNENIVENTGIDSIIEFDYMGSTEFQFGALPQSLNRMLINIEFYDVIEFPQYVNSKGENLMVYAPIMFNKHVSQIVEELADGSLNSRLKEYCNLPDYLMSEKNSDCSDFWWDIENDFYIFFGLYHKELILEAQKAMIEKKLNNIEVGDWDELSSYYLLVNNDLDDEAKELLRLKKSKLVKRLVRTLKYQADTNK